MSDDQQEPAAGTSEQPATQEESPAAAPSNGGPVPGADKKVLAGILAIVFGSLGVHKFILGYNKEGIILLSCTLGGYILGIIGSMVVIGCVFFLLPTAAWIVGVVEGIMYLTKSDEEFANTYVTNKKPWF